MGSNWGCKENNKNILGVLLEYRKRYGVDEIALLSFPFCLLNVSKAKTLTGHRDGMSIRV